MRVKDQIPHKIAPPRLCWDTWAGASRRTGSGGRVTGYSKLYTMSGSGARDGGGISPRSTQKSVFHTDAEIAPGPVCFVICEICTPNRHGGGDSQYCRWSPACVVVSKHRCGRVAIGPEQPGGISILIGRTSSWYGNSLLPPGSPPNLMT